MALGPSAPSRWGPTWAEFLRSQEKAILATDFFTVTLLESSSVYVLAIIEHANQRVRILGVTAHSNNRWVMGSLLPSDHHAMVSLIQIPRCDLGGLLTVRGVNVLTPGVGHTFQRLDGLKTALQGGSPVGASESQSADRAGSTAPHPVPPSRTPGPGRCSADTQPRPQ